MPGPYLGSAITIIVVMGFREDTRPYPRLFSKIRFTYHMSQYAGVTHEHDTLLIWLPLLLYKVTRPYIPCRRARHLWVYFITLSGERVRDNSSVTVS